MSRQKILEQFDEDYILNFDEPEVFEERSTNTITWDRTAVPGQSILKRKKSEEKEPSSPIDKLNKIEKDIEIISEILLSREDEEVRAISSLSRKVKLLEMTSTLIKIFLRIVGMVQSYRVKMLRMCRKTKIKMNTVGVLTKSWMNALSHSQN